jgi:ribosomal protein S18 acetylase RimI-like enzyme
MITVRDAGPQDAAFMLRALGWAANWRGTETHDSGLADPAIRRYLDGWPREGDFGVVAEDGAVPVGAAWCRIFPAEEPGFGFVAPDIPELSIAVAPANRGKGVGRALLDAVVERGCSESVPALSLSVEDGNEAVRLYEKVGFRPAGRNGGALTMKLDLW